MHDALVLRDGLGCRNAMRSIFDFQFYVMDGLPLPLFADRPDMIVAMPKHCENVAASVV